MLYAVVLAANLNKEVENKEVYNVVAELERFLQWPAATEIERTGIYVPPVRLSDVKAMCCVGYYVLLKGLEDLLDEKQCLNFLADGDRKILHKKAISLRGTAFHDDHI